MTPKSAPLFLQRPHGLRSFMNLNEIPTVVDQKGREYRLTTTKLQSVGGTRYATRASIANVLRGTRRHVVAGSAHPKAKKRWAAVSTTSRLRIGCRKFAGKNFELIYRW